LSLSEQAFGPDHPDFAAALEGLANIYYDLSQYDRSIPLLQRAMSIRQSALGADHPRTALNLSNMAYVYHAVGQPGLAIAYAKAAVNSYQIQRQQIAQFGSTALQTYTGSVSQRYQYLADMLVEEGRLSEAQLVLDMLKEEEQFEFTRRSAANDPRIARIGYNPVEQVWMNRYRQIADQLAALGTESIALQKQEKLGLSEQQKVRQKTLVADLKVAQKAFDAFLGEMQEGFARQSAVRTVETEELSQKAMRVQQDLIASLGSDVSLLRYYITDDKVGMLLTTAGVSLAHSTTINAKELNRQIMAFRGMLIDRKSNPLVAARALYSLLVAPVANDIEKAGAKTVMLSLDGPLRYLPFGALHDGKQFLAQRWNLPIYTSVTKNRLLDGPTPQWRAVGLGVTRAQSGLNALPAVKDEMESIVKSPKSGVFPGEIFLDEAFTAQKFREVGERNFQLLHVSSHFQFSSGGTEANSFLLLGDGRQLTLGDIRTQNYRFDKADLLTLSACETGLGGGRDATGREIEGFGVIAQQQGAKAVIATLWSVDDRSSALLMVNMYRLLNEKHLTKIEALRQAQLSLMAQPGYSHPFYWAPVILMGNWR
jgi:CHAT domain-containing protein